MSSDRDYMSPELRRSRSPQVPEPEDYDFSVPFAPIFQAIPAIRKEREHRTISQVMWIAWLLYALSFAASVVTVQLTPSLGLSFWQLLLVGLAQATLALVIYWPKYLLWLLVPVYAVAQGVLLGLATRFDCFILQADFEFALWANYVAIGAVMLVYQVNGRRTSQSLGIPLSMALSAVAFGVVVWAFFLRPSYVGYRSMALLLTVVTVASSVWAAGYQLTLYVSVLPWRVKGLSIFPAHQLNKSLGAALVAPWLALFLTDIWFIFVRNHFEEYRTFRGIDHLPWEYRRRRWKRDRSEPSR